MIVEKLQMPYILASQHPVVHAGCLCATLIIILTFSTDLTADWGCEQSIKIALITLSANNFVCLNLQFVITMLNNRMFQQYKFTELKEEGHGPPAYNFSFFN